MITIPFEKGDTTGLYILRDALVLPDDHTFTESEMEVMKQDRFDNWYLIVTTPPIELPIEPPVEYLLDENGNTVLDENGNPIPVGV